MCPLTALAPINARAACPWAALPLARYIIVGVFCIHGRQVSALVKRLSPIALSYQLWKLASLLPPESLSAVEGHGFRRVDRVLPSTKRRPFDGERVAFWI
jgi:hypothetical protein